MLRRDFIRRWGRIVLLAGIAGTAGYLALTDRVTAESNCTYPGRCGSCSLFSSCKDSKRQRTLNHGK
jgi:hypothetical protein